MLAVASAIYATSELRSREFLNAPKHVIQETSLDKWKLYIEFDKEKFRLDVSQSNGQFLINIDGKEYKIEKSDINLAKPLLNVKINGEVNVIQPFSKNASGDYQIM